MESLINHIDDNPLIYIALNVVIVFLISAIIKWPKQQVCATRNIDGSVIVTKVVETQDLGIVNIDSQIPILLGWDYPTEVIGRATLRQCDNALIADLQIYDTLMTKEQGLENYVKQMHPSIGGRILHMDEDGNVTKFKMVAISLSNDADQCVIKPM